MDRRTMPGQAIAAAAAAMALVAGGCADRESDDAGEDPAAPTITLNTTATEPQGIAADRGQPVTLARARSVQQRNADRLMAEPGVIGHGIGRAPFVTGTPDPKSESFVILVMLEHGRHLPGDFQSIDGVPLDYMVTGPIGIHDAGGPEVDGR